jgi:hypothetical protein
VCAQAALGEGTPLTWRRDSTVAGALAPPPSSASASASASASPAPRRGRGLCRVDLAVHLPRLALLFECDEDAHRPTRSRYDPGRERARMDSIASALARGGNDGRGGGGVPCVFVRVAAPRKALGAAQGGALWGGAPALAALRADAAAAATHAATAAQLPARGCYRVIYVGYGADDAAGGTHPGAPTWRVEEACVRGATEAAGAA